MANPVSPEERGRIVALLKSGKSQNGVAKEVGRSPSVVNRIAREEGIENIRVPKKATEARKAYAEERRLEIIGKGFEKADVLLAALTDAREFQAWTIGLGTLVDKARLEMGEATSREERLNGDVREKRFSNLFSQIDAYRTGVNDSNGEGDRSQPVYSERPNS